MVIVVNEVNTMFKEGMVVKWAEGWHTAAEKNDLLVILENYEDIKRCMVGYINTTSFFGLVKTVDHEMIVEA